jgi:hypothetical protein
MALRTDPNVFFGSEAVIAGERTLRLANREISYWNVLERYFQVVMQRSSIG